MNTVSNTGRERIAPLPDSLHRHPNRLGGLTGRAAQKFDSFAFVHAELNHNLILKSTAIFNGHAKVACMDLATRLRSAMERASVSNRAVAEATGMSVQGVGQILGGQTKSLSAASCVRIAEYLGVRPFWLATGEGEMLGEKQLEQFPMSDEERDLLVAMRVLSDAERDEVRHLIITKAKAQLLRLTALVDRQPLPENVRKIK